MAEITDLEIVDASNTARMPENQAPSTVNNGVRALEGILARGFQDAVEGDINSAGGTTVYTVAANRTISAYYEGLRQGFHVNATNTGAVTLNIDSVGAKDVRKYHDVALAAGDWQTDQYVEVIYSASDDRFQMLSPSATPYLNSVQPAFLVFNSATDANVTGDGTTATVDFDTEVFDQGADFASDTFTAPATGRYLLYAQVRFSGLTTGNTVDLKLVTSNRTIQNTTVGDIDGSGTGTQTITAVADMDSSDTATITIAITGVGADTADIEGASNPRTYFSGCLLV